MDIAYLHALQQLRESLPGFFETFFVYLSYIGDGPGLVLIMLVVYWCVSKRAGQLAFASFGIGNFTSQLIKNIACVYRPWIRDASIIPAERAIEGAGGYSFPSGHTCGTTTSLGSFAWFARKKNKAIVIVCVVVILLMCFSRNFLGVHTPQDVIVALIIALIAIALVNAFFNWIDRYDALEPDHNKDILVAVIVIVVSIASVVFVALKPYPLDYVEGALLVEPESMMKGSFEAAGICIGMVVGWVLERRFVDFSTDELATKQRIIRFVIGAAIVGITYIATDVAFKAIMPYNYAKLFAMMIVVFMALFIAPLAFSAIERRR